MDDSIPSPSSVESSPNDSLGERLKDLKERSKLRRKLLAGQLGLTSPDSLGHVLQTRVQEDEVDAVNHKDTSSPFSYDVPVVKCRIVDDAEILDTSKGIDWKAPMMPVDDEFEEEEIYTDSSAFLKGTQSANPHNDYCQHFVDTGERPHNFIHDVGLANRFEEYPKLRELIRLKDELIQNTNSPPMYLKCDLETYDVRDLGIKFDSILIEPPLEEYQRTLGVSRDKYWSWEMLVCLTYRRAIVVTSMEENSLLGIENLEIDKISAHRSFLWIWCGSSDGLDAARRCLRKWGFRRCEDICWVKTNIKNPGHNKNLEPRSIFQRTKEHCLMGIKGTVRRSTDGDFIHANVDIDIIIDEEKEWGSPEKPVEIFHIAEHFCLGRRRLHIFGRDSTIRPGWLTVGPDLTSSNFDPELYSSFYMKPPGTTSGCTEEIERLRPKSPPPKNKGGASGTQMSARGGGQKGGGMARGGPNRGGSNRGGPHARGASSGRGGMQRGGGSGVPRGGGGPRRGGGDGWGGRGLGGNYGGGRGRGGHKGGPPPR